MVYLQLFYEFFLIGLFALGGGNAAIPFLFDLADKYPWYTHTEMTNMIAIAEATPGPVGVNMATYAGYNAAGFLGGIIASSALILPGIIIILCVAKVLSKFSEHPVVKSIFRGIRPAVTALIAYAVWGIFRITLFTEEFKPIIPALVVFILLFAAMQIKKLKSLHPIFWFALAAIIGILFKIA